MVVLQLRCLTPNNNKKTYNYNGWSMDVLVVTSKIQCKNLSAKPVARKLWNDFFLIYVFPKRIHSD